MVCGDLTDPVSVLPQPVTRRLVNRFVCCSIVKGRQIGLTLSGVKSASYCRRNSPISFIYCLRLYCGWDMIDSTGII